MPNPSVRGYLTPVVPSGTPSAATISIGTENSAWYAGDYLLLFCISKSTGTRNWVEDSSGYGGVPELSEDVALFANDGTNYFTCRLIYRKLAAGNRTSYTVTHASSAGGQIVWGCIVQDANDTTLKDVALATNSGTGTLTATYPDLTTVTDGALVLYHAYWTDNADTVTGAGQARVGAPSKGSEFVEWVGADSTLQIASYTKTTAGAVGTTTAAATNSGGGLTTSDYWLTFSIAIRPAASVPAVTFDDTSYQPGDSIVVTASPAFASAMTTLTLTGGDTISASGGATGSSATFVIPAYAQFKAGGSMNNTKFGISLTGTVTDGTDDATDTFTMALPTGKSSTTLASIPGSGESLALYYDPDLAVDDVLIFDTVTTPGGYTVVVDTDGTFSYDSSGDSSRQSFEVAAWDDSAGAHLDQADIYVNNGVPDFAIEGVVTLSYTPSTLIADVDLDTYFFDAEDDTLTYTIAPGSTDDVTDAGLSLTGSTITGTTGATPGTWYVTIRATDIVGDYAEGVFQITVATPSAFPAQARTRRRRRD